MDDMPKKVPNIPRLINNDILKVVNIVFSISGGGGGRGMCCPPQPPCCVWPGMLRIVIIFKA